MGDADPRQNQKPRVIGDEADVALPRFRTPADVAVPAAQMARCRTPRQARDGTALPPGQVLQVLSDRLFVFQIMMLLHQTVEQRLVARVPPLLQLDGP